jgi:hypothetical protein
VVCARGINAVLIGDNLPELGTCSTNAEQKTKKYENLL